MNLSLFFAMAFGVGAMCFWLFVGETIQGRMTRYTTWKEMTIDQWVLFLGSFLWPIGFLGLLLFNKG